MLGDMDEVEQLLVVISRYEAAQVHAGWFARYGELYQPGTAALIRRARPSRPATMPVPGRR